VANDFWCEMIAILDQHVREAGRNIKRKVRSVFDLVPWYLQTRDRARTLAHETAGSSNRRRARLFLSLSPATGAGILLTRRLSSANTCASTFTQSRAI
jgi:hypothetical protein